LNASEKARNGATADQFLTFRLGNETYGLNILRVKEIRGWVPVTAIPQSPPHVLGILNLRGAVVPIVDLRRRFELASAEFTPVTVVIVLSLQTPKGGARECGVVVDSVSDVVDLEASGIRPAPALNGHSLANYILGVAESDDRMVMLMDIEGLLQQDLAVATERNEAA
jgi:purine-binding chemotaxis protein CheW